MKKLILFILFLFSLSLYATENVINDFESSFFARWGTNGNPTSNVTNEDHVNFSIVDNPSKTGINLSNKVGKFHRLISGMWWAQTWFEFSPLQVTASVASPRYLHVSIYKPIISRICAQVKNALTAPTVNTGEMLNDNQTKINEWQDMVYKITITGTVSDIEIKPDFVSSPLPPARLTGDIDIYIDNIVINDDPTPLGETPVEPPHYKGKLPEGFEGDSTLIDPDFYPDRFSSFGQVIAKTDLTVAANPRKNGINTTNKCAKFIRKAAGSYWAGVFMIPLNPLVVDATNKYFHAMVYRESDPTPLSVKLETSTGNTGDIILQGDPNGTYDWIDYVFEIPANKYGTYEKFDIMPDFLLSPPPSERYFEDALFYFDAFELNNSPTPRTSAVINGISNAKNTKINAWSDGKGNVQLRAPQNENCSIQLYNSIGELVNSTKISQPNGVITIRANQLSGIILVRLTTSKGIFVSKVRL
jgi:hypothetical protein